MILFFDTSCFETNLNSNKKYIDVTQVASDVTAFDIGSMLACCKREKVTRCEGLKAKSKQFVCLNWLLLW